MVLPDTAILCSDPETDPDPNPPGTFAPCGMSDTWAQWGKTMEVGDGVVRKVSGGNYARHVACIGREKDLYFGREKKDVL